jgi:hypothetical protein
VTELVDFFIEKGACKWSHWCYTWNTQNFG